MIIRRLIALIMALVLFAAFAVAEETSDETAPAETEATENQYDEPGEENVMQEIEEQPIAKDEILDVEDLMLNTELDDGWWNILLIGSDSRNPEKYYGLADTIVIASIHPESGRVKLTSIMRDMWLKIYGSGEGKINATNSRGGPELVIRTVNEYFDMNISDYVLVSIEALADIIDMLGGINVDITEAEMKSVNKQIVWDADDFELNNEEPLEEFGEDILLNGNQALAYARIRNIDSDYVRTERQRNVLIAIADSMQDENLVTILGVAGELLNYVETNLSFSDIASLAGVGMSIDLAGVEQLRIPVEGTYTSGTVDGVWRIDPDYPKNAEALHNFIYNTNAAE